MSIDPDRFQTFSEIWEQDAKWLSGKQILEDVADSLVGKSLTVVMTSVPGEIVLCLPLPMVNVGNGERHYQLFYTVPKELRLIMEERLQLLFNNYKDIARLIFKKYEGTGLSSRTISSINNEFMQWERERLSNGYPALPNMARNIFGLFDPINNCNQPIVSHNHFDKLEGISGGKNL